MRGQDTVGFITGNFADGEIAPADRGAVRLEGDWSLGGDGGLTVVVVLEGGVVDGLLAVEPDADAGTGHDDAEAVPFAGWLVGQHEWVFARLAR